jgi:hypothetical protein
MFAMLLEMQCKDTIKKAFFQMFSSGRITSHNDPKIDVTYGNICCAPSAVERSSPLKSSASSAIWVSRQ